MGRLIREDDVMRMLTGVELNNGTITDAKIELRNVKTAYNVEKVVAELEEAKEKIAREDYCRTQHYNDCEHKDCFKCCAEYLIDIVRKGGVE